MKKITLSRAGVVAAIIAVVAITLYAAYRERQWRHFVASTPKLSELLEPLPDDKNAAPLYYAAIEGFEYARPVFENHPMVLNLFRQSTPMNNDMGGILIAAAGCPCKLAADPPENSPPIDDALAQAFVVYFAAAQPAYDLLQEADGYDRFRMKDYSSDTGLDILLNHLAPMRDLARQISYRARWLQLQGEYEQALRWIERGLRLSNGMEDDVSYISFLVRSAMAGIAIEALNDLLCAAGPDLLIPPDVVDELRHTQGREQLALPLLTERASYRSGLAKTRNQSNPFFRPFEIPHVAARIDEYLEAAQQIVTEADFRQRQFASRKIPPLDPQPTAPALLLKKLGRFGRNPPVNTGAATANDFNGWEIMWGARDLAANAIHSADRFIGNAALAEIGVYLHQYRAQHGQFPDTLDAIVPEFAESLPEDPFSGNPFVYKPAENEYILYSLGMNYRDDGGVHDVVDGDMVWCISHHAQP